MPEWVKLLGLILALALGVYNGLKSYFEDVPDDAVQRVGQAAEATV